MQLRFDLRRKISNLVGFVQQPLNGAAERAKQFVSLQRCHQCAQKEGAHIRRKVVKAPAVVRRKAAAPTGEAQGVVASAADPVFGVPVAAPFDAEARPQCMVRRVAEKLVRGRRLDKGLLHTTAEEQLKLRAAGPKSGRGRKREVELKAVGEQKYPIEGRSAWQVEQVSR